MLSTFTKHILDTGDVKNIFFNYQAGILGLFGIYCNSLRFISIFRYKRNNRAADLSFYDDVIFRISR